MHPLIKKDLQEKAKQFEKKKNTLNIIETIISGIWLLIFYLSGLSNIISIYVVRFSMPIATIIYILSLSIPVAIILFPISYLKNFKLEKDFDLSTQSIKSWLSDNLKGILVSFILGFPIILLLFYLFIHTPDYWWIFSTGALFLFQIFLTVIFPVVLLPIFFKQKKIENENLTQRIKDMLNIAGIKIKGIYSINLSSKTKRENAALTGLFKTRRVLVGDTLLKNRSEDEIICTLAHEVGHHLKYHILKLSMLEIFTSFFIFFTINRIMHLFIGFTINLNDTLTLFPLFIIFFGIISFPVKIIKNIILREFEKEADKISLNLTKNRDAFISLMAELANSNLSNAYPKKLKVFLFYSHPPVGRRIELAEGYK